MTYPPGCSGGERTARPSAGPDPTKVAGRGLRSRLPQGRDPTRGPAGGGPAPAGL